MAEKVKKGIPWFLILALLGLVVGITFNLGKPTVKADNIGTSVTVGNAAPNWTVDAQESAESSATNPTNAGQNVSFVATGTDPNGDDYYLAVCKTTGITPVNGGAPTCDGGAGDTWDVSDATDSASQATATYTTSESNDPSNAWFAYICDGHASAAACHATVKQGTDTTASPFIVNHGPSFTVVGDAADPVNPGATVTITTTASDAEGAETDDTLTLYVCKVAGATSSGCTGGATDEWCHDTSSPTTNPTCNWTMDIAKTNSVTSGSCEGSYNYYPYIFDNHGFAATATGGQQGQVKTNTVNNVKPVVDSLSWDTSPLTLSNEETTTDLASTATVHNDNGCADIDSGASDTYADAYRSSVTHTSCDASGEADYDSCYPIVDSAAPTGCGGGTDISVSIASTIPFQYHADSTVASSQYPDETWIITMIAKDEALSSDAFSSSGVEMNMFLMYDFHATYDELTFGSLSAGQASSSDVVIRMEATGNVGLDEEVSASNSVAYMCTDYPTCAGSGGEYRFGVEQEKYDLVADQAWADMDYILSTSATERELNCEKTIDDTPGSHNVVQGYQDTFWRISIPGGQAADAYTGQNTIAGATGESAGW